MDDGLGFSFVYWMRFLLCYVVGDILVFLCLGLGRKEFWKVRFGLGYGRGSFRLGFLIWVLVEII